MHKKLFSARRILTAAGLALAAVLLAHAQGAPQNMEGKTAEQVYKNIKVLNGTPAGDVLQSMHLIVGALSVSCEYCHVEGDFAKDDKETKVTARKMMQMMIDINKNSFDGRQVVTCYTCHRNRPEPPSTLVLPFTKPAEEPKVTLPSVDQILAKYVEALGGEQAIRRVTSRVVTGTEYIPTGPGGTVPLPATIEHDQKAPNLIVNTYHAVAYTIADGFDGTTAWSQDLRGRVTDAVKLDQARAKRDSDFYLPLDLKRQYTKMEVQNVEKVNDHDAYVVVGSLQDDLPEKLYFDTLTGLLLRKETILPTQVGDSPFQVNYDDYRDTGSGVKVPYLIVMYPASERSETPTTATIHVTKVQDDAPIDDAKFARPKPAGAR